MNEAFMKERPVLPLLASMAIPMVISMLVNSLYNIVDSFYVAQISEDAMSALSLVYPVQNLINALAIGFGIGINAAIAFYLGAGDQRKADQAASQGMLFSILHGVVIMIASISVMPVFLGMFRLLGRLWRIFTAPIRAAGRGAKKFSEKRKKHFQNWLAWYKINVLYNSAGDRGKERADHEGKTGGIGH